MMCAQVSRRDRCRAQGEEQERYMGKRHLHVKSREYPSRHTSPKKRKSPLINFQEKEGRQRHHPYDAGKKEGIPDVSLHCWKPRKEKKMFRPKKGERNPYYC